MIINQDSIPTADVKCDGVVLQQAAQNCTAEIIKANPELGQGGQSAGKNVPCPTVCIDLNQYLSANCPTFIKEVILPTNVTVPIFERPAIDFLQGIIGSCEKVGQSVPDTIGNAFVNATAQTSPMPTPSPVPPSAATPSSFVYDSALLIATMLSIQLMAAF